MINKFYFFILFFQILKIHITVLTCFSNKIQIITTNVYTSKTTTKSPTTEYPINWTSGDWAHGCDFYKRDLIDFKTTDQQCGPKCKLNPECTHYTWTSNDGGICWLKYGNISKDDAFQTDDLTMLCGIARTSPSNKPPLIDWQKYDWAYACDFTENMLINIVTRADNCGPTCSNHPQCTHFTWKDGICYLKKGSITKADAFLTTDYSKVCGVVRENPINSDSIIDWKNNHWAFSCDFNSKNIAILQTPGEQCSSTCNKNPNCTHFTWSPVNNGSCYLKSGNINKNDAIKTYDNKIVCGIVRPSPFIDWKGKSWTYNCDFFNHDLKNVKSIPFSCEKICSSTPNCTHYSWTSYEGGTCWLKYGEITKNDAHITNDDTIICGIV